MDAMGLYVGVCSAYLFQHDANPILAGPFGQR